MRCYEFRDMNVKAGKTKLGRKSRYYGVKTYEDYLRESDYSQALKDLYFKHHYKYLYIPERLWNNPKFIENLGVYKNYLDKDENNK
jgi:hypothetical protein